MVANEVLELLSKEILPSEFECYIKQLKFNEKSSNSTNVVFNAPNEIIAKFIQTKYAAKIAHLFEVKTGQKPVVEVQAPTKTASKPAKKEDVKEIKAQSSLLNPSYTFENFKRESRLRAAG